MLTVASAKPKPQTVSIPEPCVAEGECEVIYDANLDWRELEDRVVENKMYVNPVFTGKLTAVALKNVVFLNGKLGVVDLSAGAVLNGVVFRGNQIDSLNFGGATLSKVVLEGNLKQQPTVFGDKEDQLADPIPLNLRNAIVRDSLLVNNVIVVNGNKNTVIHRTSFVRNNMIGSHMKDVKISTSDFSGNDARDSDLRFSSAADIKIFKNQVHGTKYPTARKARVAIYGNWANDPVKEWVRLKIKKPGRTSFRVG
jgi:hypothetical protein